jgi:hypothetical protein
VDNLLTGREHELEIWIRPERIGSRYTVEWTTVDYDWDVLDWVPRHASSPPTKGMFETVTASLWQLLNRCTLIISERMPSFDVDQTRINAFPINDTYLFKQYFEQDAAFSAVRQYYNATDYRFEVPADDLADVQNVLADYFYDLTVVDDVEQFCVVKQKYTDHPDVLFKTSVLQRQQRDHTVFLMKDQLSVEQAVNHGVTRLADTDLDVVL